jgi:DNA-binding transcriptional MerR regulator
MDGDHTLPRWSLLELTQEAGVSVRTVRYYIAEGLLPPPDASGPRSFYTQGHLDRLRLIDRLKASYLPLKEIRRRLSTLDDAEVRRLLASELPAAAQSVAAPPTMRAPQTRPPDSATTYIARLLNTPDAALPQPSRPAPAPARPTPRAKVIESPQTDADLDPFDAPAFSLPPTPEARQPSTVEPDAISWRRIPLSDDAELLIRDDTYQRKRDRVDWLIDWARKVFN